MSSLKPVCAPQAHKYIVVYSSYCWIVSLSVRITPQSSSYHQGEGFLFSVSRSFRGSHRSKSSAFRKPFLSWGVVFFCKHFPAIRKWPFSRWMLNPIQITVKGREGTDMLGLCWDGVLVTLKGREGVRGTGRGRWVVSVRSIRCRVLVVDGVVLLRVQDVSISSLLREVRIVCYFSWNVRWSPASIPACYREKW